MPSIQMHWEAPGKRHSRAGGKDLGIELATIDDRIRRVITGQFGFAEDETTAYAKLNAPWTDDSGNARSGLFTTTTISLTQDHWELILSHAVFYGIFLEVCNSGKYAIIMPTIRYIGPKILKRMERSLARIEAVK